MFRKSKKTKPGKASTSAPSVGRKSSPSVISSDMNVLGNIISEGFIDIDGKVEGNVKCDSAVIRSNGSVRGDVIASDVHIYGYVEGLVKATSVSLFHSAHVSGTIMHESLAIEDGAFVDGKFKRISKVFVDDETKTEENAPPDDEADKESELNESVMDNLRLISH